MRVQAICHWYTVRGASSKTRTQVCARLHETYVMLSHNEVWGCQVEDLVWSTFLK